VIEFQSRRRFEMYVEGTITFIELKDIFDSLVGKLFPLRKEGKKELKEMAERIENLYIRYGDNELFRTEFESWLVSLIRRMNKEKVQKIFSLLPMEENIKKEVLADLKEAIKTVEIQEELKTRADELEEKMKKVFG
jgi:hypothetical protein